MGMQTIGTYDLSMIITQRGLNRMLRAQLLETWAPWGLPRPLSYVVDGRRVLVFLGLPQVEILPRVDNQNPDSSGMIYLTFPFFDSTFLDLHGLNGRLDIGLDIVTENGLEIRTENTVVEVAMSGDDPDPHSNGQTSAEKVSRSMAALISSELQRQIRSSPPDVLSTVIDSDFLGRFGELTQCTVVQDEQVRRTRPVVCPPALPEPRCGQLEVRSGALLFRGKVSELAVQRGTATDIARGNLAWSNERYDFGVMVSNRFLLEELLPAALLPPLMEIDRGALRAQAEDAIDEEIEAENSAAQNGEPIDSPNGDLPRRTRIALRYCELLEQEVASAFAFPMVQMGPVSRTIPLPRVSDLIFDRDSAAPITPEEPNVVITNLTAALFPGGVANSVLRLTMNLQILEPDRILGQIAIDVIPVHRHGALEILMEVARLDLDLQADIGTDFSAFVVAGVLNFLIDIFGTEQVNGTVEADLSRMVSADDIAGGIGPWMLIKRTYLDDLEVQGDFRLKHDIAGTLRRNSAAIVEKKTLQKEASLVSEDGSPIDFCFETGGEPAIRVDAARLLPQPGFEIARLNALRRYQAENLGLVDAHDGDLVWQRDPIAMAPVDVDAADAAETRVSAVAVRSENGQRAVLYAGETLTGSLAVVGRVYKQLSRELYIVIRPYEFPVPAGHDAMWFDPDFYATYGEFHNASVDPGGCAASGRSWSQRIEVPRLVGDRHGVLGHVNLGVTHSSCQLKATAMAVAALTRGPRSEVRWAIILPSGDEVSLTNGETQEIDISPSSRSHLVRFAVDETQGHYCQMSGEPGKDARFTLTARMTEMYDNPMAASLSIDLKGEHYRSFGFDRWLDIFERTGAMLADEIWGGDPVGPEIRWAKRAFGDKMRSPETKVRKGEKFLNLINGDTDAAGLLKMAAQNEEGVLRRHTQTVTKTGDLLHPRRRSLGRGEMSGMDARDKLVAVVENVMETAPDGVRRSSRYVQYLTRSIECVHALPSPKMLVETGREGEPKCTIKR